MSFIYNSCSGVHGHYNIIASTVIFCGSSFSRNTRMHTTLERVMCALALCPITTSSSQQLARTVLHAAGTMHCGLHNGIHG